MTKKEICIQKMKKLFPKTIYDDKSWTFRSPNKEESIKVEDELSKKIGYDRLTPTSIRVYWEEDTDYSDIDLSLNESVKDHIGTERLNTPRGTFKIYNGTWEDFKKEEDSNEWNSWFDYKYPEKAPGWEVEKVYKIMYRKEPALVVAVLYKDYTNDKKINEDLIQSDSDEAFKKNVETEIKAGKPKKQALAIAYSIKEKNRMKKNEDLEKATPYMLRNDGAFINCSPIHPYIKFIFESTDKSIDRLSSDRFFALEWFYNNTKESKVKDTINIVVKYLLSKGLINKSSTEQFDLENAYLCSNAEIGDFINILNADTNQEFLRARTSHLLFGGKDNSIYFRISSIRFNWFNLIWELVYKYRNNISDITICKDSNTFGTSYAAYEVDGEKISHMPVEDFIMLRGNPVIESVGKNSVPIIEDVNKKLMLGVLISEAYNLHPRYAFGFYQKQVEDYLEEDVHGVLNRVTNIEENLSKNMSIGDIAKKHSVSIDNMKKQVEMGIKVEKEHTDDPKEAERIALDHLFEIPDYYDRLTKMEKDAKRKESLKEDDNTETPKPQVTTIVAVWDPARKCYILPKEELEDWEW